MRFTSIAVAWSRVRTPIEPRLTITPQSPGRLVQEVFPSLQRNPECSGLPGWMGARLPLEHWEVPDDVYRQAREQFSEADLANLTLAVAAINSWNRLNIAFRKGAGKYQPPKAKAV